MTIALSQTVVLVCCVQLHNTAGSAGDKSESMRVYLSYPSLREAQRYMAILSLEMYMRKIFLVFIIRSIAVCPHRLGSGLAQ